MQKVPYPYEVNGKLVTGNGSLIPICSLSNRSLLPSLTVLTKGSKEYHPSFKKVLYQCLLTYQNVAKGFLYLFQCFKGGNTF